MHRREEAVTAWCESGGAKRTLEDLYEEVRKRWKEVTPKPFPWRHSSDRVMFGKWRKGKGQRFAADNPMRKVLVEVLSVEDAALFPPVVQGDGVHPMRGFEALGAIDPRAEKPSQAAALVRVSGPGRANRSPDRPVESLLSTKLHRGRHWVVAPIGAGRTLAALACEGNAEFPSLIDKFMKGLGEFQRGTPRRVLSLATLDGLRATAQPRPEVPLVVKVERPGENDVTTAEILARVSDVLVLATFLPPRARDETDDSYVTRWEEWNVWMWRPDQAWRREFVDWVAERIASRLPHGEFVAADVVEWLDGVDPKLERYGTPADLLPVLELAHQHGARNLPEHLNLDFVRRHLARAQDRAAPDARGHWLRAQGALTMIELVRAAWRDPRVQWPARLTEAEAAGLLPSSTLPSFDDRHLEVKRLVTSLTRARTERKRADIHGQITRLMDAVDRPGEAVSVLVDATLLHPAGGGRFSLGAYWVQELVVEVLLEADFVALAPPTWGRLAVDAARQPLVDRVLRGLSVKDFFDVVTRALAVHHEDDLGSVGAIETLFLGAPPHMKSVKSRERLELLARLWQAQRSLLVLSVSGKLAAPRTRGGPNESARGGARWWAACWAWSLGPFAPDGPLPESLEWLFPGWFESIGAVPDDLMFHREQSPHVSGEEMEGVATMFDLAPRFIERWLGPTTERAFPDIVVSAAIPAMVRVGWPHGPLVKGLLRRDDRLSERVAASIEKLTVDERERVIAALWEVAFEGSIHLPDVLWLSEDRDRRPGALGMLMRRSFPVDAIVLRIGAGFWWGAESCKNLLAATPPGHRVSLAQVLLKDDARRTEVVSVLLEHPETFLELLVEIAPLLPEASGREVAQGLWRHAPDRAEELARAAWVEEGTASPWMDGVTMEHRLRLVRIFLSHLDRPVPERFLRWLARSIPELGAEADRVFGLMQAQGWSRLAFEVPTAAAAPIVSPSTRRRS